MPAPCTRCTFALVASIALVACPLAAQAQRVSLPVGTRVRVAAPPRSGWVVGRLAVADSSRVVLWSDPGPASDTILLTAVRALEVSRGRPRAQRVVVGMLVGGVALGATAGLITNAAVRGQEEGAIMAAAAATAGFVGGVIIGGTVAALTAPERWKRMPIP